MRLVRSRRGFALAIVGTLLGIAGVAYATIPDSSGAINTCYANDGGALRAVDGVADCTKDEQPLALGGPTRGYAVSDATDIALGSTSVAVARMVLPAGTYLAHAKVNVANLNFTALGSTFVPCSMQLGDPATATLDQTWVIVQQAITGTGASSVSIGLQGAVTIPTSVGKAELIVRCASVPRTAGPTTRVIARYRQLDAIQVDALNP